MKNQIKLLEKYGVSNYTVKKNKITINGYLDLRSLTAADKDFLNKNVKQLKSGYNKKRNYCFFDGILSNVLKVSLKKEYTIYTTPFDFVVKKGKNTAHGKTAKKAIQDLEFKIIAKKISKDPIRKDTLISIQYYRLITGACELGCKAWMDQNKITKEKIKAVDLLPILENTNAYGLSQFKKLINF